MRGFEFLNLVIGLTFIYLIYSIGASTLWEMFVNITHLRGTMLRDWIMKNFDKFNFNIGSTEKNLMSNKILEHPLIKGMSKKPNGIPTYISSRIFTDVLVDLVVQSPSKSSNSSTSSVNLSTFRNSLKDTTLLPEGLKRVFLQYTDEASDSLQNAKEKISIWYDEAQERLIGTYKKNLQKWILVISIILVGSTNADTIRLASYLYNNDAAREAIATKASLFVQDSAFTGLISRIDTIKIKSISDINQKVMVEKLDKDVRIMKALNHELKQTSIPLGWGNENIKSFRFKDYLKKLGGLLLTVLAVSMGSPFWFDLLSKLSNLRSSGNKPKLATTDTWKAK